MEWSGIAEETRKFGLVVLLVATVVHGVAVAACVEAAVVFRDGQVRLRSFGEDEETRNKRRVAFSGSACASFCSFVRFSSFFL